MLSFQFSPKNITQKPDETTLNSMGSISFEFLVMSFELYNLKQLKPNTLIIFTINLPTFN